jgi:hypothetical protein
MQTVSRVLHGHIPGQRALNLTVTRTRRGRNTMQAITRVVDDVRYTVNFGMRFWQGNDQPYFSITVDTVLISSKETADSRLVAAGHQHYGLLAPGDSDIIREVFPERADLLRYHMTGQNDGLPMHYIANTIFWLREGQNEEHAGEHAISAARWGSLEGEVVDDLPPPDRQLLQMREPGLREDFNRMMKQHNVRYIAPYVSVSSPKEGELNVQHDQ